MHRIDNSTAVATMPIRKPQGTDGFFSQGNQTSGQLATIVEADILNAMMMEIANVVTKAGIALNKLDDTQLWAAINALINASRLGFMPVEQGGGYLQGNNKVRIGWATDGGGLKSQVDNVDLGPIAFLQRAQNWTATQSFQVVNAVTTNGGTISGSSVYSSGAITAAATVTAATVNSTGNVNAAGTHTGGAVSVTGNVSGSTIAAAANVTAAQAVVANTGIYPAYGSYPAFLLYSSGGYHYAQYQAGYYWQWDSSTGNLNWVGNGGLGLQINPNGRLNVSEAIFVSTATASDFSVAASPGARGITWQNGYSFEFQLSGGIVQWFGPGRQQLMSLAPNGSLSMIGRATIGQDIVYSNYGSNAFSMQWDGQYVYAIVNGTGIALQAVSDERVKQDIAPSTFDNLAAIRSIPLFEYRWKDLTDPANPLDARAESAVIPVGFIAQRLHEAFPEGAIVGTDADPETGDAKLWSVDDHTMIASLTGAMQQIAASLDTLTSRVVALEDGGPPGLPQAA